MKEYKPSLQIGYLLKVVQHEIRKRMDRKLGDINLTTPQYAALSSLYEFPGTSNAELARKCFITPQTMNLIIRKLEKRGIIQKEQSPEHGRVQNIVLSEAGSKLLEKAHEIVFGIEAGLTSKLSEKDKEILKDLLLRIDVDY